MQVGYQKWVALAAGRETARCQCRSRKAAQRWAMSVAALVEVTL
jgi:hypothetical protein